MSFDQVSKCYDTLVEKGVTSELCQDVLLGQSVLADVAEAVVKGTLPKDRLAFRQLLGLAVATIYKIVVDYSQTIEHMIDAAGLYDWNNINIIAGCFPVKGEGQVELEPELVHFDRTRSSEVALAELDKRGLRPGTIEELLAFGEAYPEVQREFRIVALGSVARVDGSRYVPFLDRDGSRRYLNLQWFGGDWYGHCRFLAFRKVSGS